MLFLEHNYTMKGIKWQEPKPAHAEPQMCQIILKEILYIY